MSEISGCEVTVTVTVFVSQPLSSPHRADSRQEDRAENDIPLDLLLYARLMRVKIPVKQANHVF